MLRTSVISLAIPLAAVALSAIPGCATANQVSSVPPVHVDSHGVESEQYLAFVIATKLNVALGRSASESLARAEQLVARGYALEPSSVRQLVQEGARHNLERLVETRPLDPRGPMAMMALVSRRPRRSPAHQPSTKSDRSRLQRLAVMFAAVERQNDDPPQHTTHGLDSAGRSSQSHSTAPLPSRSSF